MFGLSLGHLLIIAVVVLLFGRRRLPAVGHAFGRSIAAFKQSLHDQARRGRDDRAGASSVAHADERAARADRAGRADDSPRRG